MPTRLVDHYPLQSRVQILLQDEEWHLGWVVVHQHPGVWVQTLSGHRWFVTNTRRIRLAHSPGKMQ